MLKLQKKEVFFSFALFRLHSEEVEVEAEAEAKQEEDDDEEGEEKAEQQ